jgi:hypothetical protein
LSLNRMMWVGDWRNYLLNFGGILLRVFEWRWL